LLNQLFDRLDYKPSVFTLRDIVGRKEHANARESEGGKGEGEKGKGENLLTLRSPNPKAFLAEAWSNVSIFLGPWSGAMEP